MHWSYPVRFVALLAVAGLLLTLVFRETGNEANPFVQVDPLARAMSIVQGRYVREVDAETSEAMVEAGLAGLVGALEDPHSQYLPPADAQWLNEALEGLLYGIGANVDASEGRVRIVSPMEGSPAALAGVMAGDIVTAVDGESVVGLPLDEAVEKIKGEADTDVRLTIDRGEVVLDVVVRRGAVSVSSVEGLTRTADFHPDYLLDPARRVGYIRLSSFTNSSGPELLNAYRELAEQAVGGLIFDMRGNPGGPLMQAAAIGDLFLPEGKVVVSTRERDGRVHSISTERPAVIPADLPIVVIVDGGTASAAEIVAGALQDHGRAFVVGERSYGKGSVQEIIDLTERGDSIKLTVAHWLLPSGRLLDRLPDSEAWGVDPSPGGRVPMGYNEARAAGERRNDLLAGAVAWRPDADDEGWLAEATLDPQLSAAYTAVLAAMRGEDWPDVGVNDDEADRIAELRGLEALQRDLQLRLEAVDDRIAKLVEPAVGTGDAAAAVPVEEPVGVGG